jgi:hypothetical protein
MNNMEGIYRIAFYACLILLSFTTTLLVAVTFNRSQTTNCEEQGACWIIDAETLRKLSE